MKLLQVYYLVGGTMIFVALYALHEDIWPGEGIFLRMFASTAWRISNPKPPGDFSGLYTAEYFIKYYLPTGVGLLMCVIATWLKAIERVPPHEVFGVKRDDFWDD